MSKKIDWKAFVIILSVAAVLGYHYLWFVGYGSLDWRVNAHREIISGTAQSPYIYRVLAPFMLDPLINWSSGFMSYEKAFLRFYGLYEFLAILAALLLLYALLREWFSEDQSMIGVLFTAVTMTTALLRDNHYVPWSWTEIPLFILAVLLIYKKRYLWIAVVTFIAALNRETAVLIPLVFLFTQKFNARNVFKLALYGFCWMIVYAGLRYIIGSAPPANTIQEVWRSNTQLKGEIALAIRHIPLFLGAFWFFAVLGWRHAPDFIKKASLVVPIYLAFIGVFGIWHEVRLLTVLYPILIPLALSYLYTPRKEPDFNNVF